jgi:hypothetical protein
MFSEKSPYFSLTLCVKVGVWIAYCLPDAIRNSIHIPTRSGSNSDHSLARMGE